ncbi:flavin-dependent monooxygenase [Roseomonas sp. GC11]|uniref:acyl-CoA dehydrogenase family protein n=1 Tax=Roseomonas sp. GC11 TaxID=2950546 RepID=UPI00210BEBD8|nr:acyl-CoA dehydrogenase family protein [Roseomonas sp. GC11]MCQ4159884.1 flavin-dependent monooxygenase [Roseomonas sp. GC11]
MNHAVRAAGPLPDGIPGAAGAFGALLAEVQARRDEFAAQRHLSPDIIERLRQMGVYRALVARRFGGDERSPGEFCQMIERIAQADGSAGWVASFGAAAAYLAALPEATLEQVYAQGPDVVFAGGLFPLQPALRTPEGFRVSGCWKFASGCMGASLIGAGISVPGEEKGGLPRVAVMPADRVTIRPNWDVIGLQGTGSHDVVIEDVLVPEAWTLIRGGAASVDSPVYRYPTMALAAQVLAVVGLGVARAALDEVTELAGGRVSITGAPRMADRPYVQSEVARAEAMLRASRAFFYEATETVWRTVLAGDPAPAGQVALLRLASTHAARASAQVARIACGLAGTTAIYSGHALARAMCDSLVVSQHAFLSEGTLQSAGRLLLGLPGTPGFP